MSSGWSGNGSTQVRRRFSRSSAAGRERTYGSSWASGLRAPRPDVTEPIPSRSVSEDTRVVRLTIPAKAEYITLCRLALAGISHYRPLTDETLHDLKLALTEACTNSVRHAYENGSEGEVEVVYELGDDHISIEVTDQGPGFDVDAPGEEEEMSESGLGIAIIRSVADELEIDQLEGKGSRLRFVKRLADAA
jgi:serine/threonine-protein kinase RsbW